MCDAFRTAFLRVCELVRVLRMEFCVLRAWRCFQDGFFVFFELGRVSRINLWRFMSSSALSGWIFGDWWTHRRFREVFFVFLSAQRCSQGGFLVFLVNGFFMVIHGVLAWVISKSWWNQTVPTPEPLLLIHIYHKRGRWWPVPVKESLNFKFFLM